MDLILHYILPNLALFGGIYLFGKLVEKSVWYTIENYETLNKAVK